MSKFFKTISDKIEENPTPIIPLGFKVLIVMDKINDKTEGGIILPSESREKEESGGQTARIVDYGPAAFEIGAGDLPSEWKTKPEVGARILINRYGGIKIFSEGIEGEYRLLSDKEILAIIKE